MIKNKSGYIIERFCPVVGKNVVMKIYYNGEDKNKTICLNDLRCSDERGGCNFNLK
jgi:hypothetical protein